MHAIRQPRYRDASYAGIAADACRERNRARFRRMTAHLVRVHARVEARRRREAEVRAAWLAGRLLA